MPAPSSLTLDWNALLTTTLMKQSATIADNISASNYLFYRLREVGAFKETADLGERYKVNLMYGLAQTTTYAGYDTLPVDPVDGVTAAFFDWRNIAAAVTISGDEKRKNRGAAQIVSLLETKVEQARTSMTEFWGRAFLQGNGINAPTAIETAYVDPVNGSAFVDPLPLLVKFDPTTSTTVGNINQSTYSWWRNVKLNDTSTTFAGFRKNLRQTYNNCGKGGGGGKRFPDIHITDQATAEFYEEMLTFFYRNTTQRADIPFRNVTFNDGIVVWDENVPDVANGTTTQSATSGTWYMINSAFIDFMTDSQTNFRARPTVEPANQDASVSQILWTGAVGVKARRKHGVIGSIDTTITS